MARSLEACMLEQKEDQEKKLQMEKKEDKEKKVKLEETEYQEKEIEERIGELDKKAGKGDSDATFQLAMLYEKGIGDAFPPNLKKAIQMYCGLSQLNHAPSLMKIAGFLENGCEWLSKNELLATKIYKHAEAIWASSDSTPLPYLAVDLSFQTLSSLSTPTVTTPTVTTATTIDLNSTDPNSTDTKSATSSDIHSTGDMDMTGRMGAKDETKEIMSRVEWLWQFSSEVVKILKLFGQAKTSDVAEEKYILCKDKFGEYRKDDMGRCLAVAKYIELQFEMLARYIVMWSGKDRQYDLFDPWVEYRAVAQKVNNLRYSSACIQAGLISREIFILETARVTHLFKNAKRCGADFDIPDQEDKMLLETKHDEKLQAQYRMARLCFFQAIKYGDTQRAVYEMGEISAGIKDPKGALKWYESAGEGGYVPGMYKTAVSHHTGDGTTACNTTALKWYERAHKNMPQLPQHIAFNLGLLLAKQKESTSTLLRSLRFYAQAAHQYEDDTEKLDCLTRITKLLSIDKHIQDKILQKLQTSLHSALPSPT